MASPETTILIPATPTLVGLSSEIRYKIFQTLMVWPNYREVFIFSRYIHHDISDQLLRTCRPLHDGGAEVLYGENVFKFSSSNRPVRSEAHYFSAHVGSHSAYLKRLKILEYDMDEKKQGYQDISSAGTRHQLA